MRESMASLTARFSANRMVREYTGLHYLPAAAAYRRRSSKNARLAADIEAWRESLAQAWPGLRFGSVSVTRSNGGLRFEVQVYLGDVEASAVRVELYAEPSRDGEVPVRVAMERGCLLPGAIHGFTYNTTFATNRPADDFTPRVVPAHGAAAIPLEAPFILWQK
jgi:starch phosphorylase